MVLSSFSRWGGIVTPDDMNALYMYLNQQPELCVQLLNSSQPNLKQLLAAYSPNSQVRKPLMSQPGKAFTAVITHKALFVG